MSEPIAACITIGGKLSADLAVVLCESICAEGVALEWGDALFRPQSGQELLDARQDQDGVSRLWLCDDRADWGRFPVLEEFLIREGLPFDRQADHSAEYDADLVIFRPGGEPITVVTNVQGEPVITTSGLQPLADELASAIQACQNGDVGTCLARLNSTQSALQQLLPPTFSRLPAFEID